MLNSCHPHRLVNDQILLGKICFDVLMLPIPQKPFGDNKFVFTFIEGRDRKFGSYEELAALKSTRIFSNEKWPIYMFLHKNAISGAIKTLQTLQKNIINDWNIHIIPIETIDSREKLNKFMVLKMYDYIPSDCRFTVNIQADGFLYNSHIGTESWEDYVSRLNVVSLGSPWEHNAALIIKEDGKWFNFRNVPPVNIGNGGFTIRNVEKCREIVAWTKNVYGLGLELAEFGNPNFDFPPEDLLFNFVGYSLLNNPLPSRDDCKKISIDPINFNQYLNKESIGFHCPKYK